MDLRQFAPIPDPIPEVLQVHDLARQFHREVEARTAFEHHCEWYYATAAQHRRELQKMQRDINLLGWFCRRRNR